MGKEDSRRHIGKRPPLRRVEVDATGRILPHSKREALVLFLREKIDEAKTNNAITIFPTIPQLEQQFTMGSNTISRTVKTHNMQDELREVRDLVEERRLAERDARIVAFLNTPDKDGKYPTLTAAGQKFGLHVSTITYSLRRADQYSEIKERLSTPSDSMPASSSEEKPIPPYKIKEDQIVAAFEKAFEEIAEGTREILPTNKEIAATYGVRRLTVANILTRRGLTEKVRQKRKESTKKHKAITIYRDILSSEKPVPVTPYGETAKAIGAHPVTVMRAVTAEEFQSPLAIAREQYSPEFEENKNTAWFLGAIMGGGSIKKSRGQGEAILFTSSDRSLLSAFQNAGEEIIGKEGSEELLSGRKNPSIRFNTTEYANLLADFTEKNKTDVILKRYKWVLEEPFIVDFCSGVFDGKGIFSKRGSKEAIVFRTSEQAVAQFYLMMLKRFGLVNPRILKSARRQHEVYISSAKDLITFADKITSRSKKKKKFLKKIQETSIKESDVVTEWSRITVLLGHTPRYKDILLLYRDKKTKYHVSTYIGFFGYPRMRDKGSFSSAQERLSQLHLSSEKTDIQIFP